MKFSNIEFIILQIVYEEKKISGYTIGQLLKRQSHLKWIDTGSPASIYVALNKLLKKKMVTYSFDIEKQGSGPILKKFAITTEGTAVLRRQIIATLSSAKARDCRFDLALAAITAIMPQEIVAALRKRKRKLAEMEARLQQISISQGEEQLPLNLRALYKHPQLFLQQEIKFVDILLRIYRNL